MPTVLRTFPDLPTHTQEVSLDGVSYQIELRWRERSRAWYISLGLEGFWFLEGRRLTPETLLFRYLSRPEQPPGEILVRGPADYSRQSLGDRLILVYYSAQEVDVVKDLAQKGLIVL